MPNHNKWSHPGTVPTSPLLMSSWLISQRIWCNTNPTPASYNLGQNKMEQQTPIPPKSRMGKWHVFSLRAPSSLIWGDGGLLFHLILSKIVASWGRIRVTSNSLTDQPTAFYGEWPRFCIIKSDSGRALTAKTLRLAAIFLVLQCTCLASIQ